MTTREKQTIDVLNKNVQDLKKENEVFKTKVLELVETINQKVEQEKKPFDLEKRVVLEASDNIKQAVVDAIQKTLVGYNTPFSQLVHKVLEKHNDKFASTIENVLLESIENMDFEKEVKEAIRHKLSRLIINASDGIVEKAFNKLKENQVFSSKLLVAINKLVEDNELQ